MQQNQHDSTKANDISLIEIYYRISKQKLLILLITSLFTISPYIYSSYTPDKYTITALVNKPNNTSAIIINRGYGVHSDKVSYEDKIYGEFLTKLNSKEFQKRKFFESGFYKEIYDENTFEELSLNQLPNINITSSKVIDNTKAVETLISLPYIVKINNANQSLVDVYSRFVDDLIFFSNSETISEFKKNTLILLQKKLDDFDFQYNLLIENANSLRLFEIARIKEEDNEKLRDITSEIEGMKYILNQSRLNKILQLTNSAKIAKSLGITKHNLSLVSPDSIEEQMNQDSPASKIVRANLPDWYLYGEEALLEQISLLNNNDNDIFNSEIAELNSELKSVEFNNVLKTLEDRTNDIPFIKQQNHNKEGLTDILNMKKQIELDIEEFKSSNFDSMSLYQSSHSIRISKKTKLMMFVGFIAGFMFSILIALFRVSLKE